MWVRYGNINELGRRRNRRSNSILHRLADIWSAWRGNIGGHRPSGDGDPENKVGLIQMGARLERSASPVAIRASDNPSMGVARVRFGWTTMT